MLPHGDTDMNYIPNGGQMKYFMCKLNFYVQFIWLDLLKIQMKDTVLCNGKYLKNNCLKYVKKLCRLPEGQNWRYTCSLKAHKNVNF